MPGNSFRTHLLSDVGGRSRIPSYSVSETGPFIARLVTSSEKRRCPTLIIRLKNHRKSDPIMGWETAAIVMMYEKVRRSTTFRVREGGSKVLMVEPFAACRGNPAYVCRRSTEEGARTLIFAPLSTRKRWPLMLSPIKKRQLRGRPPSQAITSYWQVCFPAKNKDFDTGDISRRGTGIPAHIGSMVRDGGTAPTSRRSCTCW